MDYQILTAFFYECCGFWTRCGKTEDEAIVLAAQDVKNCQYNPFKPRRGKDNLISQEAKDAFFRDMPDYYKSKLK